MLEPNNAEINVEELMARVRAEVQRRETDGTLPSIPPVTLPPPRNSLETRVVEEIRQARQKHIVDTRLPEFTRGLFRDQSSVNIRLIHVVEMLAEHLAALRVEQSNALKAEKEKLENEIAVLKGETSLQRQALTRLLNELKRQDAAPDPAAVEASASEAHLHSLDAFYLAFENRYRGSREEIKKRLKVYLPYVAEAGAGTTKKPILDLGCGRGEWLELLKENGYTGRGVDMNIPMLSACRELGLEVIKSDAMAYLRSLPDRSLGMVTGFHIIEHLPFRMLLELMSELYRVLQDGGLVVLETPNPGNVQVGACNFYNDPTHRRPLPSTLTGFLVEYAGFKNVHTLFLQPGEAPFPVGPACSPMVRCFNEHFFAPQDYAVLGSKPAAIAPDRNEGQARSGA